jgi:hypothetical protein
MSDGKTVTNLADPTNQRDAANKKYVDTNSWSINGNETTSARVIGTLNEQDLAIIRNNQTMLTFNGDGIKHLNYFIFNTMMFGSFRNEHLHGFKF